MKKTIIAVFFYQSFWVDFLQYKLQQLQQPFYPEAPCSRANYNITKTEADTTEDWNSSANAFLSLVHSRLGEKGGLFIEVWYKLLLRFKRRQQLLV